jgi:ribonuclease P protein component
VHSEYAFDKEARLTRAADFRQVFKLAKKFKAEGINLFAYHGKLDTSRLGISVPKKYVRRAVDRNKIKRIIRENFRLRNKELPLRLDMVFVVYTAILKQKNHEIRRQLDILWEKLIVVYRNSSRATISADQGEEASSKEGAS